MVNKDSKKKDTKASTQQIRNTKNFNLISQKLTYGKNEIGKRVIIKPNKGTISIDDIDKIYNSLTKKYNASDISVRAMMGDGTKHFSHTTLTGYGNTEENIRFALDDYMQNYGDEVHDKFSEAYELVFNIRY
jgi:hypothetical protein